MKGKVILKTVEVYSCQTLGEAIDIAFMLATDTDINILVYLVAVTALNNYEIYYIFEFECSNHWRYWLFWQNDGQYAARERV